VSDEPKTELGRANKKITNLTSRIKELEETIKFGTVSNERLAEEETKSYFIQSKLTKCQSALEKYGNHKKQCLYHMGVVGGYDDHQIPECNCGFKQALGPEKLGLVFIVITPSTSHHKLVVFQFLLG